MLTDLLDHYWWIPTFVVLMAAWRVIVDSKDYRRFLATRGPSSAWNIAAVAPVGQDADVLELEPWPHEEYRHIHRGPA
jgi:hypothetical protein